MSDQKTTSKTESTQTTNPTRVAPHSLLRPGLEQAIASNETWASYMPDFNPNESLKVDDSRFQEHYTELLERLYGNYPFFHPLYAGQMLKPPHTVAMLGYMAAMQINPNNHALDGGPPTAQMEKECVAKFADLFGFENYLGHLTSSGTTANLEALWVSRELDPEAAILYSDEAHYTHHRIGGEVLKAEMIAVKTDDSGRLCVQELEEIFRKGKKVGTVVVTLGTTGLGALDPLDKIIALQEHHDFRIHVDMAYGGYYATLAEHDEDFKLFELLSNVDSIVIDPHKQGLQPYGCGCVLFNQTKRTSLETLNALYRHDSPYTYFSSDELHLGEISLECSRAGASASALWLTLNTFPLKATLKEQGMPAILAENRQAAKAFVSGLQQTDLYEVYVPPETDIVTYFFTGGKPEATSTEEISMRSRRIFNLAMNSRDYPLYLATINISADKFKQRFPHIEVNTEMVTILRSCLLKPEHADWVQTMVQYLTHHGQMMMY